MLKILLQIYLVFVFPEVTIFGEEFQACDSSSVEKEDPGEESYNARVWREELMNVKDAVQNPPPLEDDSKGPLPCRTEHFAQLTWPSGAVLYSSGGIVKYDDISEKPKVIWPCHGSKLYGLVLADLETVLISAAKVEVDDTDWKDFLWFVCNIPGNKVDQGVEIRPYQRPSIASGSHRVIIAIHEQSQRVDMDTINAELKADKAFYDVFKTFNGTLVAGNAFNVER